MSEQPIALVTGGAGGIGAACCRALAKEGFRVGVGFRSSAEAARALRDEIGGFPVPGDIAVAEDVEKIIADRSRRRPAGSTCSSTTRR